MKVDGFMCACQRSVSGRLLAAPWSESNAVALGPGAASRRPYATATGTSRRPPPSTGWPPMRVPNPTGLV